MTRIMLKARRVQSQLGSRCSPYDIALRYNFGYNNYKTQALDCRVLDEIEPLHLFFSVLRLSKCPNTNPRIRIFRESDYKALENRDTLNPIPLLDEIDEMPKIFCRFCFIQI